jgi:hypothetical protein
VEAVQLRAPTILFIDDNPMNIGEAQHYVPGIQTADENFIPEILANPLFKGKDDSKLSRLAQYKLLERRKTDEAQAGGDNTEFLRESGIVVTIEHDMELHLDRAIELINRTNQLNFTKVRLSEDIEEARKELRELLSGYAVQAGILRVRDRYGDYGYCGLYIMTSGLVGNRVKHFCFSCRILNMGVETWLYRRLGEPQMRVVGEVLTDVVNDTRDIDWITVELPGTAEAVRGNAPVLSYVYARGACDLHAVTHYFKMVAGEVHGEFNVVEDGVPLPLQHTMFARHAIKGLPPPARRVFGQVGYNDSHFESFLAGDLPPGRAVWLLSFWAESNYALYRHNGSGLSVPVPVAGFRANARDLLSIDPEESGIEPIVLSALKKRFTFAGIIGEEEFKENLTLMLNRASAETSVFILQASDTNVREDGKLVVGKRRKAINEWIREVTASYSNVTLLKITDFADEGEMIDNGNHYDRMVYFKIFQEIMRRVQPVEVGQAAE